MSWLGNILSGLFGGTASPASSASTERMAEWERSLHSNALPSFVAERLEAAKSGKAPWVATMSAAELGLARSKGIRPLAMVSGTCWFHYGYSWTRGHFEGWHRALSRLKKEAQAVGANAVVDVKMRKIQLELHDSMDFTLVGTAVRIDGVPAGQDPVVATVPALEFVRLLEADIVPVGIAIGAQYHFLNSGMPFQGLGMQTSGLGAASLASQRLQGNRGPASMMRVQAGAVRASVSFSFGGTGNVLGGNRPFTNMPLPELSQFWEDIRRHALIELRKDAQRQGNGVLAHTHFGQLLKIEQSDNQPPRFLGRHIVIGTVVDTARGGGIPHDIRTVIDMRDELSPLANTAAAGHNAYPVQEEEGAI
jgi:putative heavy-metal-binding protein